MQNSHGLFHGGKLRQTKWLSLAIAMIVMTTALCLPAFARGNRNGKGMMGDIRDGVRQFGRDVSDMVDPDQNGILPDGSIDNGIQNDGNQNGSSSNGGSATDPIPGAPDTTDNGVLPGVTDTTPSTTDTPLDPTPGTDDANRTDEAAPNTTAPTTTTDSNGNQTTDDNQTADSDSETADDGGFRWAGIVIALVAIAAVVGVIVLLIPKKKD